MPQKIISMVFTSTRWLAIMRVASIVVPLAMLAGAGLSSYFQEVRDAKYDVQRTLNTLQRNASTVFDTAFFLGGTITRYLADNPDLIETEKLHGELAKIAAQYPQIQSISIIDGTGQIRASSLRYPLIDEHISVADREYFRKIMAGEPYGVVEALVGRIATNHFFGIALPHRDASGDVNGAILVGFSEDYFRDLYQITTNDPNHIVALMNDRGRILMREPIVEPLQNPDELQEVAEEVPEGVVSRHLGADHVMRYYGWRHLGTFPVKLEFGISEDFVLGIFWNNLFIYMGFAVPAASALFIISMIAIRYARREEQAVALLVAEHESRLAAERNLMRAQRMEMMGQIAGGIAHDFNNMLTVIIGQSEMAMNYKRIEAMHDKIRSILAAANQAASLTRRLLLFARRAPQQTMVIDLNEQLTNMERLLITSVPANVRINFQFSTYPLFTNLDAHEFDQVVLNLVVNARDAMLPNGGTVVIKTKLRHVLENEQGRDYATISVTDTGSGMTPEVMEHMFEPFFTTKKADKGTGLGLSTVYGFVNQNGGQIEVTSELGAGTTIVLHFPLVQQEIVYAAA